MSEDPEKEEQQPEDLLDRLARNVESDPFFTQDERLANLAKEAIEFERARLRRPFGPI